MQRPSGAVAPPNARARERRSFSTNGTRVVIFVVAVKQSRVRRCSRPRGTRRRRRCARRRRRPAAARSRRRRRRAPVRCPGTPRARERERTHEHTRRAPPGEAWCSGNEFVPRRSERLFSHARAHLLLCGCASCSRERMASTVDRVVTVPCHTRPIALEDKRRTFSMRCDTKMASTAALLAVSSFVSCAHARTTQHKYFR